MTRARSTIAARLRDKIALGVILIDSRRMVSPKPGISTRMIARIASGVTSRAATPVPPVARINPHPWFENERIVSWMRAASSGTMASPKTCHPYFSAASFTAGPPRSSYSPEVARSETVIIPTVICISWTGVLRAPFRLVPAVIARRYKALRFLHQVDAGNLHLLIHRFAHVINREQRDGHAGQRFHLNSGL